MSGPITITHYGPEPGPRSLLFTANLVFEDGDLGAQFTDREDIQLVSNFDEEMIYKYMNKSDLWSKHPVVPKELQDDHRIQTKIFHYALATVQARKMELGKPLRTPLTPHPDVEMTFPKLRSINSPEL